MKNNPKSLEIFTNIARQIVDDYKITKGVCFDIGTGPGNLGMELAKLTDLEIFFIDEDPKVLKKAEDKVKNSDFATRSYFKTADVLSLPFSDDFADLIISRGSLWFWSDQVKGILEIYRTLKPGGIGFVGGGLGRYTSDDLRNQLKGKKRKELEKKGIGNFLDEQGLKQLIEKTGLKNCSIIRDREKEEGTWIEIRK